MKCKCVGQEYVYYHSPTEPKIMILEKRNVYVRCTDKKATKLAQTLHEQNSFALFMLNMLMQQPEYNGWKIKEK